MRTWGGWILVAMAIAALGAAAAVRRRRLAHHRLDLGTVSREWLAHTGAEPEA